MALGLLSGCGSSNSDSNTPSGDDASDAAAKTKLVVATSPDFPPFESLEGGEVVGIEVDILKKVAEKMGMELDLQQMDFDSVIPGVQAGKFDVGMSGITVTDKRKENVDFSSVYFMAAQAIVVTADSGITGKAIWRARRYPSRPVPPLRSTAWATAMRCWPLPPTTTPPRR